MARLCICANERKYEEFQVDVEAPSDDFFSFSEKAATMNMLTIIEKNLKIAVIVLKIDFDAETVI